ncbi:MAG: eL32 family ribosomal protein [Nanobdellota archaeon]
MNLELRKQIKSKKPVFTRQDNHKKPKLGDKWRKPKGLQSKMRLHRRGYKRSPEAGWGSPRDCKGLSPEGYRQVRVTSAADIDTLTEGDGAIISATVGTRKKVELVKTLHEKKIPILNINESFLESVEKRMKDKHKAKKKQEEKKAKKIEEQAKAEEKQEEEKEEKQEETEDLADKLEDHKKQEKQEKDKVITKKE